MTKKRNVKGTPKKGNIKYINKQARRKAKSEIKYFCDGETDSTMNFKKDNTEIITFNLKDYESFNNNLNEEYSQRNENKGSCINSNTFFGNNMSQQNWNNNYDIKKDYMK